MYSNERSTETYDQGVAARNTPKKRVIRRLMNRKETRGKKVDAQKRKARGGRPLPVVFCLAALREVFAVTLNLPSSVLAGFSAFNRQLNFVRRGMMIYCMVVLLSLFEMR